MAVLKFLVNGASLNVGTKFEGHRLILSFENPIADIDSLISLGFHELNEHNYELMSDFSGHKYLYHQEDDRTYIVTDDPDDIWEEQIFVPEQAPVFVEETAEPIIEEAEESVAEPKARAKRKKN